MGNTEIAKRKLSNVFDALQGLQVQPTEDNVNILYGSLRELKDVYNMLDSLKREPEEAQQAAETAQGAAGTAQSKAEDAADSAEEACGEDGPEE